MRAMGAHYFAGTLPGDAIDDGGAQYFVEGVLSDGTAVPVVGTASAPREVEVERPPFMGKRRGTIAEVQLTSELASFNTKAPNDYMFQTEGQSSWRLGDVGVRAVRSGFGVIRGKGGLLSDLDAGRSPTDIGLTYGYVEAEWGLSHTYAIVTRPIIGPRAAAWRAARRASCASGTISRRISSSAARSWAASACAAWCSSSGARSRACPSRCGAR
ncbi:MAG: hypothetical protein U0235_32755 [Polyangiaceae bacterium]